MSPVVTIPKTKYETLKEKADSYEVLKRAIARGGFFDVPPTKKRGEIMKAFRNSKLYNNEFLKSLDQGLRRSNYFE